MPTKRKTQHLGEEIQSPAAAAVAAPSSGNSAHHTTNNASDAHLREQLEIFNNTSATSSAVGAQPFARGASSEAPQPVSASPSHGFANGATSPPDALPTASTNDPEAHIHPDLRARTGFAPVTNMMPASVQASPASPVAPVAGPSAPPQVQAQPASQPHLHPHPQPDIQPPGPSSPEDDPMNIDSGAGASADGRKAKRELSQSKRAAQNRAAQRAFRQRKEGYIKKLEQQVRDFTEMESSYKQIQSENYALREYVIHLQSRLIDTQGEFPQPPPNINLNQPGPPPPGVQDPQGAAPPPAQSPEAPTPSVGPVAPGPAAHVPEPQRSSAPAGAPLDAVAQAVAGLAAQEQLAERQQYPGKEFEAEPMKQDRHDDSEEIERQMHQDGLAAPTASM